MLCDEVEAPGPEARGVQGAGVEHRAAAQAEAALVLAPRQLERGSAGAVLGLGRGFPIQENMDQAAQGVGELGVEAGELVNSHVRAGLDRGGDRSARPRRLAREGVASVAPEDEGGILFECSQCGTHLLLATVELDEAGREATGAFPFATSPEARDAVPELVELAIGTFERRRVFGGAQGGHPGSEHAEVVGAEALRRSKGTLQGEAGALDGVNGEVLEPLGVAAQAFPELAFGGDDATADGTIVRGRTGAACLPCGSARDGR